jgi:hypothetical protein
MKLIRKALIGGVIVQVSMFVVLFVGVLFNIDRLVPRVSETTVILFLVAHPAIGRLVPEAEPHGHGVVVAALLLDTLLYSVVIYFILLLARVAKHDEFAAAMNSPTPNKSLD